MYTHVRLSQVTAIKQILGLQHGKNYDDAKSLRYGHIMLMTDQDHDGSHIKGLVINLFSHFWPSLLRLPGFLTEFITPIVKCTRARQHHTFYTIPEYETWKRGTGNDGKGWNIKYYKGLGTSTAQEVRQRRRGAMNGMSMVMSTWEVVQCGDGC